VETPSLSAEQTPTAEAGAATDAAADESRAQVESSSELHVYEPHRIGLPPLGPYLRELWQRREFAFELARSNLRAQHYKTVLGQFWLIMNPLLLAFVYFVLVDIVRAGSRGPEFLAHLMLGLFVFRLVSSSVRQGAKSVVGGGRLILNTAFPRTLLPLASVMAAFMRFLPTVAVYAVMHTVAGLPVGPQLLWSIPIIALVLVFGTGATMFVAALQVYFRDLTNILPYFLRIWLYVSPVLYYTDEVPDRFKAILVANPLYPLLGSMSDAVNQGQTPSAALLAGGCAWALGALVVGALFFISREREFAVRL
jgi:ABC-type polysaccharide/polyol phosphate export permease